MSQNPQTYDNIVLEAKGIIRKARVRKALLWLPMRLGLPSARRRYLCYCGSLSERRLALEAYGQSLGRLDRTGRR